MKSSEYWEQRIANGTWKIYNDLEQRNKELLEMYQEASLNISEELYKVAEKLKTSTPMLSDMHKFGRLTELQENMENVIKDLGESVEKFGKDNMSEGFDGTYKNIMSQLGKTEFAKVPKKVMEEMMDRPWLGSNFSERLWKNTQVLAVNLNDILTNGITQGKTITEMAIQLNNMMNSGFNVSHRLIRTETMHYLNESAFKGYEDAGCEEVEVWAAKDERVCEVCGAMHGKVYKIKKRPVLPLHSNCRCTYLPIIEDEKEEKQQKIKPWHDTKFKNKNYANKKEISNHLKSNYDIKFSDSKKYPMDKDLLEDSVNWLDKFNSYFKGFDEINPIKLPAFKVKAGIKPVGYYSYYTNTAEAVELVLNGLYFNDKKYNIDYIEQCIKAGWTVDNAKGHKTFVHEYGHHIANSMKWLDTKGNGKVNQSWAKDFISETIDDYNKLNKENIEFKDISTLVGRYGGSKPEEAFAETFAEYFGGDKPRAFAKVFGNKIEDRLNKYIKKG